jgi:hypothetical protein
VEYFTNAACDPSGYGEGHKFVKTTDVTTDGTGNAMLTVVFPSTIFNPGNFITATATDPAGNTSEFSNCLQVVDAGAITPTPAAITFKPFFYPGEIFYGTRCSPDLVEISVEVTDPSDTLSFVQLYVRLMDKKTGEKTAWSGGLPMLTSGKNIYFYKLLAYDVPDYSKFESAWLQYQFVVHNKAGEVISRSDVYGDIAFTRCSSNAVKGVD